MYRQFNFAGDFFKSELIPCKAGGKGNRFCGAFDLKSNAQCQAVSDSGENAIPSLAMEARWAAPRKKQEQ